MRISDWSSDVCSSDLGAKVAVTGRTVANLTKTVSELEAAGGLAMAVAMDVSNEESIANGIAQVVDQFGRLDIMHSNAAQTGAGGLNPDGDIVQMAADFWDQQMAINLRGSSLCATHTSDERRVGKEFVMTFK